MQNSCSNELGGCHFRLDSDTPVICLRKWMCFTYICIVFDIKANSIWKINSIKTDENYIICNRCIFFIFVVHFAHGDRYISRFYRLQGK